MRAVFLCHPVSGDVAENLARAERWLRWACRDDRIAPVAPWMEYVRLFAGAQDDNQEARRISLRRSCLVAERIGEVWLVGGEVTGGMREEATDTLIVGGIVYDLTQLGPEPPGWGPRDLEPFPRWRPK